MASVTLDPTAHRSRRDLTSFRRNTHLTSSSSLNFRKPSRRQGLTGQSFCSFRNGRFEVRCGLTEAPAAVVESDDTLCFQERYPLRRTDAVEGKIFVKLDSGEEEGTRQLTVGCSLPGKWILHWGVNYADDLGSEWDLPPVEMRPPESITIKDYAIQTPLKKVSSDSKEDWQYELSINVIPDSGIATINFVLKDEETGAWYQRRGRDFRVSLLAHDQEKNEILGARNGFDLGADIIC